MSAVNLPAGVNPQYVVLIGTDNQPLSVNSDGTINLKIASGGAGQSSSDGSSTITVGGAAQSIFGGAVPPNGWKVYNAHDSEDMWICEGGTASVGGTGCYKLGPHDLYCTEPGEKPSGVVSVYAATTGHKFTARKW